MLTVVHELVRIFVAACWLSPCRRRCTVLSYTVHLAMRQLRCCGVVASSQVHSRHKADHLLASTLLCTVNYMWWSLGHMAHHLNVRRI